MREIVVAKNAGFCFGVKRATDRLHDAIENKKAGEKLQAAKSYYNKYTSELNDLIRTFPSNIVARMHNINIKPFFDGKNMEDEIVDDFKL